MLYWTPENGALIPKELDDGTVERVMREVNYQDNTSRIGYMDCMNKDGTGPWHLCGDMDAGRAPIRTKMFSDGIGSEILRRNYKTMEAFHWTRS